MYFDDISITFTPSPVIQQQDYYPSGLSFNSYQRENILTNKYQYNGKEKQDDLGLNWLDYGARMYMGDIGKWGVVDPHGERYSSWSTYHYCADNPILLIDPTGMDWYQEVDKDGKIIAGGNVIWREGSDDFSGYKNIGANHTFEFNYLSVTFNQNKPVEMTEKLLEPDDWETQKGFPTGCYDFAVKMTEKSGAIVLSDWVNGFQMVKTGPTENPEKNENYEKGIEYMDQQIDEGKSVVIGVHFQNGKNLNPDHITDHFVSISSRTTNLITGEKSYGWYDPGNWEQYQGTDKNYVLKISGGWLSSPRNYKSEVKTVVTHVRRNK